MSNQSNKGTALITGSSSGIGAIYADRFARRGYAVSPSSSTTSPPMTTASAAPRPLPRFSRVPRPTAVGHHERELRLTALGVRSFIITQATATIPFRPSVFASQYKV